MSDKNRIKKLEDEIVELRKQLLDLALRQPSVIITSPVPASPYISPAPYTNPVYPHYDGPVWIAPTITCGTATSGSGPNFAGTSHPNMQSFI